MNPESNILEKEINYSNMILMEMLQKTDITVNLVKDTIITTVILTELIIIKINKDFMYIKISSISNYKI